MQAAHAPQHDHQTGNIPFGTTLGPDHGGHQRFLFGPGFNLKEGTHSVGIDVLQIGDEAFSMGLEVVMHAGQIVLFDHHCIVLRKAVRQPPAHVNRPLVEEPPNGFARASDLFRSDG